LVAVEGSVQRVRATTDGTKSGPATITFIKGGYAGEVQGSTSLGSVQTDSFSAQSGNAGFAGASSKPITIDVSRASGSTQHHVTVSLAKAGTADYLTLGSGTGVVTLSHSGPATRFTLGLTGSAPNGLPETFTTRPISIGANQSAHLGGIKWGATGGRLTVKIGGREITVHNLTPAPRAANITRLHVARKGRRKLDVSLKAKLPSLPTGSQAFVVWLVHRGHKLLASHHTALPASKRAVSTRWLIALAKHKNLRHKKLRFTAVVLTIAIHGATERAATKTRSVGLRVP
jgi:hypothetical protein